MKTGWIIVNGYLHRKNFEEIYRLLISAAKKKNIDMKMVTNDQVASALPISDHRTEGISRPDFVIFWDKDVILGKTLAAEGFRLFNSPESIEKCDSKAYTFLALKNSGIPMPKTYSAPLCFSGEYGDYTFLEQIFRDIGSPVIIKKNKGSFGEQVFKAADFEKAVSVIKNIGGSDFIIQEYIEAAEGRDYRLYVVGDRVVAAEERYNGEDFRSNINAGGHAKKYKPTAEEEQMVVKAVKMLGLDFAGVDIFHDLNNRPLLCEVNSNAHFTALNECSGLNIEDYIIDYIDKKVYDNTRGEQ